MALVASALQIAFWSIVIPTAIFFLIKLVGDFFYMIGTMLFRVMDMLQSVFRKLAGLGTVYVDGEPVEGDILTYIMKSNVVVDVLIAVAIFGLGLVILGSIIQMVRLEYTTEGSKNSKDKIFTTALKSLLMFIMIPIVCFVGIRLSNYMLQAVDYATSASGASTVSGSVFQSSVADASKVYTRDNWGNGADIGALLTSLLNGKDYNNAVVIIENTQAKIMNFDDFSVSTNEAGSEVSLGGFGGSVKSPDNKSRTCEKLAEKVGEAFVLASVDSEGTITVGFQPTGSTWYSNTCLESWDKLSYLDVEAVSYFYNTGNINYLILYLGAYICIKALFEAAMGMIARIYKVVALFVVAPAAIGLQPLDDGGAYKKWKGSFIQNVLSAYGFIVALNLYFMVVGVLQTIELWTGWGSWLPNKFIQFLFVLTGATMIKDLSSMFAGLIGAADAMADGAKAAGEVGKIAGSVAKVGMGAAQLGGAAFKGIGAAAAKFRKVDDGAGGKTSLFKAGMEKRAGEKAEKALDKDGLSVKDGRVYNLAGDEVTHDKLTDEQRALRDKVTAGRSASKALVSSSALAEQSRKSISRGLSAGQNFNRFAGMVKNSGLASTFNNMTGNIAQYMTGDAYKRDDEAYEKKLKKAGVDPDDYAIKDADGKVKIPAIPKAGTSFISRNADEISKRVSVVGAKGLANTTYSKYQQDQANRDTLNKNMAEAEEMVNSQNSELQGKRTQIANEQSAMRSAHSGIATVSGYQKVSTRPLEDFIGKTMSKYIKGGAKGMSSAEFMNKIAEFRATHMGAGGKYAGNSAVEEIITRMESIMGSGSTDAQKKSLLAGDADINIGKAELTAKMHDAVNNTGKYGTYAERQKFQDGEAAIAAIDEKIDGNNRSLAKAKKKHGELTEEGKYVNMEQYATEMGNTDEALNKIMQKANEDLAEKLKNEGIKVRFGEDLKFKIDDRPMIDAMTRIKEKMDQMERDRKNKESAGETNKLLKDLIEETKKKK